MSSVESWQTGPDVFSTSDLPYLPARDDRFYYAHDAVAEVERTTCGKGLGCKHAGTRAVVKEFGPGGTCELLAGIKQKPNGCGWANRATYTTGEQTWWCDLCERSGWVMAANENSRAVDNPASSRSALTTSTPSPLSERTK